MVLRDNLQPTDFTDADCRISDWRQGDFFNASACRVWVCKCGGGYWFQRHEWAKKGANSTIMDDWIFSGYSPYRRWGDHMKTAPKDYDQ